MPLYNNDVLDNENNAWFQIKRWYATLLGNICALAYLSIIGQGVFIIKILYIDEIWDCEVIWYVSCWKLMHINYK